MSIKTFHINKNKIVYIHVHVCQYNKYKTVDMGGNGMNNQSIKMFIFLFCRKSNGHFTL